MIKVLAVGFDHHIFDDLICDIAVANPLYIASLLKDFDPHVIITDKEYQALLDAPLEIRKRWNVVAEEDITQELIDRVFWVNATQDRHIEEPLVSVITPLFHTDAGILDVYRSLSSQSYRNWEWIVYDNTPHVPSDGYDLLASQLDTRIKLFTGPANGIGDAKANAFQLGSGKILIELDHDDYLTPNCLGWIVDAYLRYPDAGFYYTDCAEVDGKNGTPLEYPDGFAFGYGSYRDEWLYEKHYRVMNYPPVNDTTIRHIVGVPNHVRAWRTDVYEEVGGHNRELFVADDYDLILRTFLYTKMVHVKRFGYIQNIWPDGSNAQEKSRAEIQRLVGWISNHYKELLDNRVKQLSGGSEEIVTLNYEMD